MKKFETVDEYIFSFPIEKQKILNEIRNTIKQVIPNAEECISYGMPSYKYYGFVVHFAMHTNHIGFYPTPSAIDFFKNEILEFKYSKGAIQFPLDKPLPVDLIQKITLFRYNENINKYKLKK